MKSEKCKLADGGRQRGPREE